MKSIRWLSVTPHPPGFVVVFVVKQFDRDAAAVGAMAVRLVRQAEKSARDNPHLGVVGHRSRHDFFLTPSLAEAIRSARLDTCLADSRL